MSRIPQAIIPELKVFDFKKSLEWYLKLAGFKIEYDRPEYEFAMLSREGAWLMLESLSEKSRVFKVGELVPPLGRGAHFQVRVSDVQALYDTFAAAKHTIFHEMEEKWYRADDMELGNRQFLVQDPDGYLFRFYQDLGERPTQT